MLVSYHFTRIIRREGVNETARLCSMKLINKGVTMSRTYPAFKNKYQKRSKVNYHSYILSPTDMQEGTSGDMPAELEAEMIENRGSMRQKVRRFARRIKSKYT